MSQTSPSSPPSLAAPDRGAMLAELRSLVQRGQVRWQRLILAEALGLAIATPLAWLWLVFLADNFLHLNREGRLLGIVVFLGVLGYLVRRLRQRWRQARFTEDEVALAIERRTPQGVENRLINALQLARDERQSGSAMSGAVLEENYRTLKNLALRQSSEATPAMIRLGAAAVLIAIGLGYWLMAGDRFTRSAQRLFLPFADIEPAYRTMLTVMPGDMELPLGGDALITIDIAGEIPRELVLLTDDGGRQASRELPVPAGARQVKYTFEQVRRATAYAVRGNDFTSRFYRLGVPAQLQLEQVRARYQYPAYSGLREREQSSTAGDLEALAGTQAALVWQFNQPLSEPSLWLWSPRPGVAPPKPGPLGEALYGEETHELTRQPLTLEQGSSYAGQLTFGRAVAYQIAANHAGQTVLSQPYLIVAKPDRPPELELTGAEATMTVLGDSVLPLGVVARDDFGLVELGLYYRRVPAQGPAHEGAAGVGPWQPLQHWPLTEPRLEFMAEATLVVSLLDAVEGEVLEIAPRGRDADPAKAEVWTTGAGTRLTISGAGIELQLKYEAILAGERALENLIAGHQSLAKQAEDWARQLDPSAGQRWDDQANLTRLHTAMGELAKSQASLRQQGSEASRAMVAEAGNLQVALGMLADTEMVRAIRIIETVPRQATPREKRLAVSDARLTQERVVKSLNELRAQYQRFREDWELAHMMPFTKSLAERQASLADAALTYAGLAADMVGESQRASLSRRQAKLAELGGLAQTAFAGLSRLPDLAGERMAQAFGAAAQAFDERGVKRDQAAATKDLAEGQWLAAEPRQRAAAEELAEIHAALRLAQTELAREALAELQTLQDSAVAKQGDLARLKQGETEDWYETDPDKVMMAEIVRLQEVARKERDRQQTRKADQVFENYYFDDKLRASLASGGPEKQDPDTLKLAQAPGGQKSFPSSSDREGNKVVPHLQEEFEDLVGELLEEADDLREEFETYNINTGVGINEPGEIGKQAGDLNSSAAAAATGNQKPPTHNFGGATRSGRQGARAHGMAVGDESINRRGRDEVQEGQEDVADQAGEMKNVDSEDPQKDASTGRGGKMVGHENTSFSTKEAGEFRDEDVDRLIEPKETHNIVERQGKPLDAKVAEKMYDLNSQQEQVIARVKAIRKTLDKLYLPSDHLEELGAKLAANLEKLREAPDPEIFRQQAELLEQLRGTVVVFNRPSSDYEQSLARDQRVRGRILDEAAAQPAAGYEDAVKRYYDKLSGN